jgi:hypothetical protein
MGSLVKCFTASGMRTLRNSRQKSGGRAREHNWNVSTLAFVTFLQNHFIPNNPSGLKCFTQMYSNDRERNVFERARCLWVRRKYLERGYFMKQNRETWPRWSAWKSMKMQSGFIITVIFCGTTFFLELTSETPGFNKVPRGFIQQYVRILK